MVAVATRFREALGFPAKAIGVPLEMSCILLCHAAIPLVCQAAKAAASGTLGLGRGMEEVVGNSTGRFREGFGRWITGTMVGARFLLCRCEV